LIGWDGASSAATGCQEYPSQQHNDDAGEGPRAPPASMRRRLFRQHHAVGMIRDALEHDFMLSSIMQASSRAIRGPNQRVLALRECCRSFGEANAGRLARAAHPDRCSLTVRNVAPSVFGTGGQGARSMSRIGATTCGGIRRAPNRSQRRPMGEVNPHVPVPSCGGGTDGRHPTRCSVAPGNRMAGPPDLATAIERWSLDPQGCHPGSERCGGAPRGPGAHPTILRSN